MNDYDIKKLYEEMEQEIISSMKRNYKRHLNEESKTGFKYTQWQAEKLKELKRYQRENNDIISEYTNSLSDEISKHMQNELKQGSINAIKQYNKALKQKLKPSEVMNKSFFQINDKKVNALIKSVNDDLKTANTAILRMTNDQYRQVIHKSAFFVGNGVFTEQQASRMAAKKLTELQLTKLAIDESNKDFLSRGLACIEYKDGRRVNVASYAQMAVRTANLRAQLMGEGDFRKSIGRTLVISTSHGGACPICQKWENKVFIDDVYSGGTAKDGDYMLLSDAMKQGFLHPSCRHGLTTYYPELENVENESEEEYQKDLEYINEKLNYINRNVKKYNRLSLGSIAPENIRHYNNKKRQWEKEKELLLTNSTINGDYCIDDTKNFIDNIDRNKKATLKDAEYIEIKGKRYYVNDINKIIHEFNEVPVAEWIQNKLHKDVEYLPNISEVDDVKLGDYKVDKKEIWELKTIKGNGKRTLDSAVKDKKDQASIFILDLSYSKMEDIEAIKQSIEIFRRRDWVDRIILKRDKNILKVFNKKRN